ncbi:U4/U6 small nuclear ribonucleoprotein Prp31 [Molothrus ater]|uniref:U4/U6 small nuclear ribonucleoprotein Prp31 n=1 Tax=Molothrus ater TaxID=84834 RepID=UPI00174D1A66|nr:U4/U6 small nuclear ribonucleoprotein Prp31 [Molothrus ater]
MGVNIFEKSLKASTNFGQQCGGKGGSSCQRRSWAGWRKLKEHLGLTETCKQANRMSSGEMEDIYQEELRFSLGHLSKASSSHVHQTQVNKATKAWIRKALQKTLQKQSVVHSGKSIIQGRSSGMASSTAFTPLQGLEIVNLQAARKKVVEANQNYFSSLAKFVKVKENKNGIPIPPIPLRSPNPTLRPPNSQGFHPNVTFPNFL